MQAKTKAQRRKVLDKHRKGDVTLHVPFDPRDMMFVKSEKRASVCESQTEGNGLVHRQRNEQDPRFSADCPICKEPGKWTAIGRFACVPCRYIFD